MSGVINAFIKDIFFLKKAETKDKKGKKIEQKSVAKNALKLYGKRSGVINAFIKYIFSGDIEKDVHQKNKESETEFEKSIASRTKIRGQKFHEENEEK